MLAVGPNASPAVLELVEMSRDPEFAAYFAVKGAQVSKTFADMEVALPVHAPFAGDTPVGGAPPAWRRAAGKVRRLLRRIAGSAPN
jgi:hypothetical protein